MAKIFLPLGGWTVHDDVYPKYLHWVEGRGMFQNVVRAIIINADTDLGKKDHVQLTTRVVVIATRVVVMTTRTVVRATRVVLNNLW